MRGNPSTPRTASICSGITPADAGKTSICTVRQADTEDHPRGCGENQTAEPQPDGIQGSPPRMRGKHVQQNIIARKYRITPADAGKTSVAQDRCFSAGDHPRGCGENEDDHGMDAVRYGSPPRMRGKLSNCGASIRNIRITPADAGKTFLHLLISEIQKDHPRGCGENWVNKADFSGFLGSPPRMRGKQIEKSDY